ncbi:MAG: 4'-phosphopantetheinyl transferase superfamily protein [Candidatus Heimdallarchaeota archaeon]|nr:4'-phosphopantetheinyl transferase superfamily protein [Candidatus Heimdallarchaeota archaeon]
MKIVSIEVDALANVTQNFINSLLLPKEKERFDNFKIPKKRNEWLAGRIAAKFSLSYVLGIPFNTIEILKDENRSPFAFVNNIKTHVSISHSNGMALSTVKDNTIDLELISKRHPAFIDESFSLGEVEKYDLHNADHNFLTMLWTMKEAHLKRMRIGLRTDLHGVIVSDLQNFNHQKSTSIVVSPQGKSICESYVGSNFVVTISSKFPF